MWCALLFVGLATAAEPTPPAPLVVVAASGIPPERVPAVDAALADAGWAGAARTGADVLAARVRLRTVTARSADGDCGGEVALEGWRAGVDSARAQLQVLALADALASYVARELELACLEVAPANADLLRVELGVATAHHYLAVAARADEARRAFHEGEASAALARALALGSGLSLPPDTDPDIARAWSAARGSLERASVVVTAPPGVGVRVDGRPVADGVLDLPPGSHLVQGVEGSRVTAAAFVDVGPDDLLLVWLAPGGGALGPGALVDAVAALGSPPLAPDQERLLLAAARVVGGTVVYVADDGSRVVVWAPSGDSLRVREPANPPDADPVPAPARWRVEVGAGAAGSTLRGGELDGLGGVGPALQLGVRREVGAAWDVGVVARPSAVARRLAPWDGGGVLFRGTLPVLVGAGWHRGFGAWVVEAGVDGGVQLLGPFDTFRVGGLLTARAGASRPVGASVGYGEVWGGPGTGYVAAGMSLGIRWRH